jgi:copper homeostasis protein
MKVNPVLEVCVDSVESAVAAQKGGAQRVELCANRGEGGTTPSAAMMEQVRKRVSIQLFAMIRPRPGDFCYSSAEFVVMRRDIEIAQDLGVDGVVVGILTNRRAVDAKRMKILQRTAFPLPVTFHRAFDQSRNPLEALETIVQSGVNRLLTSGQKQTALEGLPLLATLVERSQGRTIVMPGGGVDAQNAGLIMKVTGSSEIHVNSAAQREVRQIDAGKKWSLGSYEVVDSTKVRRIVKAMKSI